LPCGNVRADYDQQGFASVVSFSFGHEWFVLDVVVFEFTRARRE